MGQGILTLLYRYIWAIESKLIAIVWSPLGHRGLSVAGEVTRIHIAWPGTIQVDEATRVQTPVTCSPQEITPPRGPKILFGAGEGI